MPDSPTPSHWSSFRSKEELSDYMTQQREDSFNERQAVRRQGCGTVSKTSTA